MKRLKVYLDTSVISFLLADDSPEKMAITKDFWKIAIAGKYDIVFSQVTLSEILKCSEPKRSALVEYLQSLDFKAFEITSEMQDLAERYVAEGLIPVKYKDDAYHLAAATVENCDIVLSWNYTHIVRPKTIFGVNGVNNMFGYRHIEILSPESMLEVD